MAELSTKELQKLENEFSEIKKRVSGEKSTFFSEGYLDTYKPITSVSLFRCLLNDPSRYEEYVKILLRKYEYYPKAVIHMILDFLYDVSGYQHVGLKECFIVTDVDFDIEDRLAQAISGYQEIESKTFPVCFIGQPLRE